MLTTIFSDDFSGEYPADWQIGHDGGDGVYAWAWPGDFAHAYSDPDGSQHDYPDELHVFMERHSISTSTFALQ